MLMSVDAGHAKHRMVLLVILVFSVKLVAAKTLNSCKLDGRFPDVRGQWIETARAARIRGYDETKCPQFVHISDCLRQSNDTSKTEAEYRYRFQSHGCHLPPLDAQKAATCLSNRRLILIGDSLAWSHFESLACLLGSMALSTNSSRLFDVKHFHKFEDSKYRGDLFLPGNASVHMRGMNTFDRERWRAWVNALGGMHKNDILLVNFGAHYTLGSLEDFKTEMQEVILGELRRLPCTVYWREYAPAHFGGPSGKFRHDHNLKTCAPAEVGETEYDRVAKGILVECGAACAHMKWLPIFGPSLARHGSHTGDHIPDKARGFWLRALHHDCRHFCLNVVDVWNQILFAMMCSPASAQA